MFFQIVKQSLIYESSQDIVLMIYRSWLNTTCDFPWFTDLLESETNKFCLVKLFIEEIEKTKRRRGQSMRLWAL